MTDRLPTGWRPAKLGDVLELKRGYDLPTDRRVVGTVPVVSSSGVSGFHSQAKVNGPGVVTGRYGTIGRVFYIERDFWPLNTTLYVRDFKGNDVRFISYFLRTLEFLAYSDKAAVPGVNRNHLHQAGVVWPPPDEQKAIAHVLGTQDDKIELNRRMNQTLEQIARTLFKSWFVDFDPVRVKAEGRQPPGLAPETAALFPDAFADSELGEIPKGWSVGTLSDVSEIIMGTSPASETYNDRGDGIPLVNGPVEFGNRFAVKAKWTTAAVWVTRPCDLVFCVRGSTTGRFVFADDAYGLGRGVCAIRGRDGLQPFVNAVIASQLPRLLERSKGSVFPALSAPDIRNFQVIVPSADVLQAFCKSAESICRQADNLEHESCTLAAIRDALLPKLLSGEIRIRGAERIVEEVA